MKIEKIANEVDNLKDYEETIDSIGGFLELQ